MIRCFLERSKLAEVTEKLCVKDGDNEQWVRTRFCFGALGKLDWFSILLGSSLGDAALRGAEHGTSGHDST